MKVSEQSFGTQVLPAIILGMSLVFSVSAQAQTPSTPLPGFISPQAPLAVTSVKPGLSLITGEGGNVVVRTTKDGLILIDAKGPTPGTFDKMMESIKAISPAPVKWVLITHNHGDHTGNIGRFIAMGAEVMSHKAVPGELSRMPLRPGATAISPPTTTFSSKRVVRLGGVRVIGYHFAPAHSAGDAVYYFPDLKTVAIGDLYLYNPLAVDYPAGASLLGWDKALAGVLKLDFDTALTGHGAPITRKDIEAFRAKLATFRERAREQVKKGVPPSQLIASIKVDDLGWVWPQANWADPRRAEMLAAELSK